MNMLKMATPLVVGKKKRTRAQGTSFYSNRPTAVQFCNGVSTGLKKTPLIISGCSSHGDADGQGCLYLNRVYRSTNDLDLEIQKVDCVPTPGGVTCMSNTLTNEQNSQIDRLVVGTNTGNMCIVSVDKKNVEFTNKPLSIALEDQTSREPCSITSISATKHRHAVAVTDSGGVYLLDSIYQDSQNINKNKFEISENSALHGVAHLQNTQNFVTVGSSPVAQLKLWDPRVSTRDGNAVVGAFKDVHVSVSYTCVAAHPTSNHLVMTGTSDGHLCVWDIRQNRLTNRTKEHNEGLTSICFGSTYSSVYTTSSDGGAYHWDFLAHAMQNDKKTYNYEYCYDHEAADTKCKISPLWETPLGVAVYANDVAVPRDGSSNFVVVAYDDGALHVSET
jgi:WD40 repeat protein